MGRRRHLSPVERHFVSIVSVKELLDAGVQFGHPTSVWNPRMEPYIFGKRNGIHIIDLKGTVRGLIRAFNFLQRLCGDGHMVLFVGTKRQARSAVISEARRCGQPYVSERWLGGMLTNFYTIRTRLKRLEELEAREAQGASAFTSKRELNRMLREKRKIQKNLDGVRTMDKLPGAVIVIDPVVEHIAVAEAHKLGIPVVALLDTDCDPGRIDIPIPGNDDAMRAIALYAEGIADAVLAGKASIPEVPTGDDEFVELDETGKPKVEAKARRAPPKKRARVTKVRSKGRARPGDEAPAAESDDEAEAE
jgi:small subunit ribosomal protein S2